MSIKPYFTILQFPNQIEFAEYMLSSIYNETLEEIYFNGSKIEFIRKCVIKRMTTDLKMDYKFRNEVIENYQDYLIVLSNGMKQRKIRKKEKVIKVKQEKVKKEKVKKEKVKKEKPIKVNKTKDIKAYHKEYYRQHKEKIFESKRNNRLIQKQKKIQEKNEKESQNNN
jgi:predicted N-acyltransferase